MNAALLRLCTHREKTVRRWHGIYLSHDVGSVSIKRERGVSVFWWSFHEHHGGRGGSVIAPNTKIEIKERIRHLFKHQIYAKSLGQKTIIG